MILHIDLNSYFATIEQQANPFLRGKPIGVAGKNINFQRTVVAAASIEAKKFGVKSGHALHEARQLCPQLILVQADYDRYLDCSQRFYRILEQYSSRVEIFSIDEAFIELKEQLVVATEIARLIKQDIHQELGEWVTASIGIAPNKFLAKLASESRKPDGLTVVDLTTKAELFAKVDLSDFCGIGPRIERRLNALAIYTPQDLVATNRLQLITEFGHHGGTKLYLMGQGIDHSPLVTQVELPPEKSFGHSYTLPRSRADWSSALSVLSRLSDQVARRMRKAGFLGRTLWTYIGFEENGGLDNHQTYAIPFNDGREIFTRSRMLLTTTLIPEINIRRIGVGMTRLVPMPQTQSLFPEDRRRQAIIPTLDRIQDRYGSWSVVRASSLEAITILEDIPDGRTKRPAVRFH